MANADYLLRELQEVEIELEIVQSELESILERQEKLLEKKKLLNSQLKSLKSSTTEKNSELQVSGDWENDQFPWTANVLAILKSMFKIDSFRPLQASCINATLSGKDTILIMPTGGGKSLCYQLPAVVSKGLTLIISPLVSLMEDQLLAVRNLGIESSSLSAASSSEQTKNVFSVMTQKPVTLKLLYVTPERLSKSKRFMAKLEKTHNNGCLSRVVIDEVHCTSQWGHDFRPDYKILGILKRQFPSVPVLGLTATATSKVLEDVREMLALKDCLVFRASYNRGNLFYEVREKKASLKSHLEVMVNLIKRKFASKSGIVYCYSRKDTEEIASGLCEQGIKAAPYHADVPAVRRSDVHMKWLNNTVQVVVATIAFGMGIDKPDVRFVIHNSLSKSMANYYQESGRAGRDGLPAHCILFFRALDVFKQSTMTFTEHTGLENLYAMVQYCLNEAECRRAVIARCFGERWTESDCDGACDICSLQPLKVDDGNTGNESGKGVNAGGEGSKGVNAGSGKLWISCRKRTGGYVCVDRDITEHCKALVSIVEEQGTKALTALKLAETWRDRQRNQKAAGLLGLEEYERILLQAIMRGVLKEDFHYTPYNTISYIGIGRRAEMVKRSLVKITVRHRVKEKDTVSSRQSGGVGATTSTSISKNKASLSAVACGSRDESREAKESTTRASVKRKLPQMILSSTGSTLSSGLLSSSTTADLLPVVSKRSKLRRQCDLTCSDDTASSDSSAGPSVMMVTNEARGFSADHEQPQLLIEIDSD